MLKALDSKGGFIFKEASCAMFRRKTEGEEKLMPQDRARQISRLSNASVSTNGFQGSTRETILLKALLRGNTFYNVP